MPSPIGHLLAGYTVGRTGSSYDAHRKLWRPLLLGLVLANLPDIDFLPGLLTGNPTEFHRLATHSLGALLLVSVVAGILGLLGTGRFLPTFLLAAAAYGSHLLLDSLGRDLTGPSGVQLFWPLSDRYVALPWPVFMSYELGHSNRSMVAELLSSGALVAVLREVIILLPVALLAHWKARSRKERFLPDGATLEA